VALEALPCFEVPKHNGGNLNDGHRKTQKDQEC
jgi:hypothetical protein